MSDSDHVHQATIDLVVVTRRQLDGEALAALFQSHAHFRVLCATTSIRVASSIARHRCPHVMLLDGDLFGQSDGETISSLVQQMGEVPIIVLDEKVDVRRLATLMNVPSVGYFTRAAPFPELVDGVHRLLRGESAFESTIAERVHQTPHGWRLRHDPDSKHSTRLTPREIEVWKLIAQGHSVKRCAELLHLAPSTVDNHKSHLMKKLEVHRALELARLAIRDGLISL
jgi:two-component system NarL family response regulator